MLIRKVVIIAVGMMVTMNLALGDHTRRIIRVREVNASVDELWKAWTTVDGVRSFLAPDARIDLRPNGRYEIWFRPDAPPGQRGSEGTSILALQPPTMLSVEWGMPPEITDLRSQHTHLLVYLEPIGENRSRITLIGSGFGTGPAWDAAYSFFDQAWTDVMESLSHRFSK
jgi:uncharacterized protein YndB with AHSA1/START domain